MSLIAAEFVLWDVVEQMLDVTKERFLVQQSQSTREGAFYILGTYYNRAMVRSVYQSHRKVLLKVSGLEKLVSFVEAMDLVDGEPAVYICRDCLRTTFAYARVGARGIAGLRMQSN